MNAIHVDIPVVIILTATDGCGYVSASWISVGEREECRIVRYNVLLSISMNVLLNVNVYNNSHNFTGLSDDRLFNVSIFGTTMVGILSNLDSAFVKTLSMYLSIWY